MCPFRLFQLGGDLEDLESALNKSSQTRPLGSGSCSALIKLLPNNKELLVSHDTWSTYQSMLRIMKKYNFAFKVSPSGSLLMHKCPLSYDFCCVQIGSLWSDIFYRQILKITLQIFIGVYAYLFSLWVISRGESFYRIWPVRIRQAWIKFGNGAKQSALL